MVKKYEGYLDASDLRFAIVVSRFNDAITERLLQGALDCLKRHNAEDEAVDIFYVPGAFEMPVALKKIAKSKKYDAAIALSCIIRGDTPHFDYVASEVAKGIAKISIEDELAVGFGVITADSLEQAINRAGAKSGNKGFKAAMSAMETANLLKEV